MNSITVDPETERRLQQLAIRTGKPAAELLHDALERYAETLPDTGRATATEEQRRARLALALARISALNPFRDIDPVAWQRAQRRDTPLPGRDREC